MLKLLSFLSALSISFCAVAQEIKLPAPQTEGGMPLLNAVAARKTTREFSTRPIDAQTLSEILWTAWGLTHDGKHSIPTSQNKQNLKVYVLQADGVWLYNPEKNTIENISKKDVRSILNTQAFVKNAPLHLAFVGSDKKNSPMHAGSAYQNVGLYCASKGLNNVVRGYFDHPALGKELNLKDNEEVIVTQAVGWSK
ncbi:MAG: nitroreductase family protein [Alphaproteobacteria bacterium]|nr:nitroreductase family protein [Alphaproteobacteria bacterium]